MGKPENDPLIRRRDVFILCIMIASIYLSTDFASTNYKLESSWFLDLRNKFENNAQQRVPPLVTDVDGDGSNEIILITDDLILQVYNIDDTVENKLDIFTPKLIKSVRLSKFATSSNKLPIALAAGYVDMYNPNQARSKVIIVVSKDFTISCFDNSMNLLWEKSIAHKFYANLHIDQYTVSEAAVSFSTLNLRNSTLSGTILVGVSFEFAKERKVEVQRGIELSEDGHKEHVDMSGELISNHFSVYALDSKNGNVLWKHDGTDAKEQLDRSLPYHAYSLDALDLSVLGTIRTSHLSTFTEWAQFRDSLIHELPHSWTNRYDSQMRLAQFVKAQMGTNPKAKSKKQPVNRQIGRGIRALDLSATLPHDADEHIDNPNVVVAHTHHGIDVFAIRSGKSILSLSLSENRVYDDVDGDGVVDSIVVLQNEEDANSFSQYSNSNRGELTAGTLLVLSGLPPKSQLFNATVVRSRRSINEGIEVTRNLRIKSAAPLISKGYDEMLGTPAKWKDITVATNIGFVTRYNGNGDYIWQLKDGPAWETNFEYAKAVNFEIDAESVLEFGSHDSIKAHVLVVGDAELSLIHREGYAMCSASIPKPPVAQPILGDFNNDGMTDVIILTNEALLGYKLTSSNATNGMLIACILLSILSAVIFLAHIRSSGSTDFRGKKSFSLLRSTDDHID